MKKLAQLFASELSKKKKEAKKNIPSNTIKIDKKKLFRTGEVNSLQRNNKTLTTSPVLSFLKWPYPINLNDFEKQRSATNPNGAKEPEIRFFLLSDKMPKFSTYFKEGRSLKKEWDVIINSASSTKPATSSRLKRLKSACSVLETPIRPGEFYYPVTPNPYNWVELIKKGYGLQTLEINLLQENTRDSDFVTFDGDDTSFWSFSETSQPSGINRKLDSGSRIDKITFKLMRVGFERPWFDDGFLADSWHISGYEKGYYSSGNLDKKNTGWMPLIKKAMYIGTKIEVKGSLHSSDLKALANKKSVALGAFQLQSTQNKMKVSHVDGKTTITSDILQIIAYESDLVPLCPSTR